MRSDCIGQGLRFGQQRIFSFWRCLARRPHYSNFDLYTVHRVIESTGSTFSIIDSPGEVPTPTLSAIDLPSLVIFCMVARSSWSHHRCVANHANPGNRKNAPIP